MSTKPYLGGSAPEAINHGCPMLYKVYLIVRNPHEPGAVTCSSVVTVAGIHNAEAFENAFKDVPHVEVIIKPDTFAYIKKMHPRLDTTVSLDP